MTIRASINAKLRKTILVALAGIFLILAGILWNPPDSASFLPLLSMAGIGVVVLSVLSLFFGIRCPKCDAVIGYIVMHKGPFQPGNLLSMSREIRHCPVCGVNVDT